MDKKFKLLSIISLLLLIWYGTNELFSLISIAILSQLFLVYELKRIKGGLTIKSFLGMAHPKSPRKDYVQATLYLGIVMMAFVFRGRPVIVLFLTTLLILNLIKENIADIHSSVHAELTSWKSIYMFMYKNIFFSFLFFMYFYLHEFKFLSDLDKSISLTGFITLCWVDFKMLKDYRGLKGFSNLFIANLLMIIFGYFSYGVWAFRYGKSYNTALLTLFISFLFVMDIGKILYLLRTKSMADT